ncbi:MAG: hypothetical protein PHE19_02185, partial [Candidatus Cloacimonetes bacterium]|nr:hypothetical protein [Candidatus Cloacimonadota bacterium]
MSQKIKNNIIILTLIIVVIGSIQYLVFKIQDIYAIYNLNSLLYSPLLTLIVSLFLFLLQLKTGERLKKRLLLILSIMAIVLTILVGFYIVEIQPVKFVLNFHKASNILKNLFAPNFS